MPGLLLTVRSGNSLPGASAGAFASPAAAMAPPVLLAIASAQSADPKSAARFLMSRPPIKPTE
jgi:hypothetical protein